MKQYIQKYGIYIAVGIAIIAFILGFMKKPVDAESEFIPYSTENVQEVNKTFIYIDVKGAVLYPGVYKVEQNSRLFQVVQLAGGLDTEADGNAINLSVILKDQDVVYIPKIDEEYPNVTITTTGTTGGVININTASIEQLQTLPGVGPSTAQSIIDYRNESGPFLSIDQIMNVSGIGTATYAEIQNFITI